MGAKTDTSFTGRNAVLLVHGGAGAIAKSLLTKAREKEARTKLEEALKAGLKIVRAGGPSLDAVIAAVKVLEDASIYNAGRGSCMTRTGRIEMDAACMYGKNLSVGSVAGITCVKNPVTAARAVMEHSKHGLLAGQGANAFARRIAKEAGLSIVDPSYFRTERAERNLKAYLEAEKEARKSGEQLGSCLEFDEPLGKKYGTVGAVAVDQSRHIAAATSTGGLVGKEPGRVGDSPIVGAGTFADDETCALSGTGEGEHFIRGCVGHEVSSLIRYLGLSVPEAADQIMTVTLARTKGEGGIIVLNRKGDYAMRYNTLGMYRGVIFEDGTCHTAIYDS